MGSRYADTDLLSDVAWSLFGGTPRGWARVQAIVEYVHNRIRFDYQRARSTRTASEGHHGSRSESVATSRISRSALCRCMNIPARYCTGYLGDIGIPTRRCADGFQRLVRGLSERTLVYVRRTPQYAADRPDRHGARVETPRMSPFPRRSAKPFSGDSTWLRKRSPSRRAIGTPIRRIFRHLSRESNLRCPPCEPSDSPSRGHAAVVYDDPGQRASIRRRRRSHSSQQVRRGG